MIYNISKNNWDDRILKILGIQKHILPKVKDSADKFSYNVGGNVTDGTAGVDLTYTEFATTFGVSDILNSSGAQTGAISDMYII